MNIKEIAHRLNDMATKGNFAFANVQQVRYKHGIQPRTWSPFAKYSIKDDYAYHSGGRKEFQFNVAVDELPEGTVFRYGMAFALYQDKTLHDSKAEFRPAISRFNRFLAANPSYFSSFKMWYYHQRRFVEFFDSVRPVDDALFQTENFVFIGKYLPKDIADITDADLTTILETFDYLMPLYELVQFGEQQNEKRISRICWNDQGWVLPSGKYGKSKDPKSHEAKHGYGHEEWLFDTGKLVKGYHYGFLEPIRKQQDAYSNKTYDVWLYTIDGETKKRYWIGEIAGVEVIDRDRAEEIKAHYVEQGWLTEMEEQIRASGANPEGFSNWKGVDLFNIRFLPTKVKFNDPYFEIPLDHPVVEQSRYAFAFYRDEFSLSATQPENFEFISSEDIAEDDLTDGKPKTKKHVREPKVVQIQYLHEAISKRLTKELRKIYGVKNVTREHPAGYGDNRIDIVVRDGNELIFYEIKTYSALKTSIREAIGQIMEYACWTEQAKAVKWIVITQPHDSTEEVGLYFQHLRTLFNLPLYYQSYDQELNLLSDPV